MVKESNIVIFQGIRSFAVVCGMQQRHSSFHDYILMRCVRCGGHMPIVGGWM